MNQKPIILDVREDLRHGREPFSRIMSTVAALQPGESLQLLAPFEPVPLIAALSRQGFDHQSTRQIPGDWSVLFTRGADAIAPFVPPASLPCQVIRRPLDEGEIVEVDARGLEPPQPMIAILEALGSLPEGAALRARTDRKPMHLYAQLAERGFSADTEELPDGSHVTLIRCR